MDTYLTALKDIVIVLAPIIVAYISYKSNKKTRRDIKLEIEKISKEKEAETKQILEKISAELESQKQLMSWQNSMPQTNEYTKLIEVKRFGNVSALPALCENIDKIINNNPSLDVLVELKDMLEDMNIPYNQVGLVITNISEVTMMLNTGELSIYVDSCYNRRALVNSRYAVDVDEFNTMLRRKVRHFK